MAPQVNLPNNVVPLNGTLLLRDMLTVSNLTVGRPIILYRYRDNGIGGGSFVASGNVQAANQWHEVAPLTLPSVSYRGASTRLTESISIQVWDGIEWSNVASSFISSGNSRPTLTTTNGRVAALERAPVSQRFTYTDGDGDPATFYSFLDPNTNDGFFELRGNRVTSGQFFTIAASELSQLVYRGGQTTGSETITMVATDGFSNSMPASFTMTVSTEPAVSAIASSVYVNEKIPANFLYSFSDVDRDTARTFQFIDRRINSNGGYFELNGVRQAPGAWFTINASQINQLFYVGGSVGPQSEEIGVRIYDGFQWSNIAFAAVGTVVRPANLTIQANHYLNAQTGRKANSITDPLVGTNPFLLFNNNNIEKIRFIDRNVNSNGGHFVLNNARLPSGQLAEISAANLIQLEYRGGTFGPQSETISFQVFANNTWGPMQDFVVNTLPNAFAPVVSMPNILTKPGSILPLSSMFNVTDADGDRMVSFSFFDTGTDANSGFFSVNGTQQPADTWISLPYEQLGSVKYHFPTVPAKETVRLQISDGTNVSIVRSASFEAIAAPGYEVQFGVRDISIDTLESIKFSTLFTKTDAGPGFTRYQVLDENFGPLTTDRSARLFLRDDIPGNAGEQRLPGVVHTLTAAQFANLDVQAAEADFGRRMDSFLVRATNDITGWSEWRRINVNTDPTGHKSLQNLGVWNKAVGDPKTVVSFSFIDGQADEGVRPPLPWYYRDDMPPEFDPEAVRTTPLGQPQREQIRQILNMMETFTNVDFVELPYQWNVADADIIFGSAETDPGVGAYSYGAGGRGSAKSGDIWFNVDAFPQNQTAAEVAPGSGFFFTAMHEIGHSMGLKHPFRNPPNLSIFNDFTYNTIMSYTDGTDANPNNPMRPNFPGTPASFMLYDIVELQRLYGVNSDHRAGNDHHFFALPTAAKPVLQQTLWDAGGMDTINLTNSVTNERIDLRQGQFSTVHGVPMALRIAGVLSDDPLPGGTLRIRKNGTVIENARGGAGNDDITGNEENNILFGNGGVDALRGGGGNDVLYGGLPSGPADSNNDTYVFTLGDGHDRIDEQAAASARDVLVFGDKSGSISAFEDDFVLRRLGNDLRIDMTLDRGTTQGSVTIANYADATNRVETVLLYSKGIKIGNDIDLTSAWSSLDGVGRRFRVSGSQNANGFLLVQA